MTVVGVRAGGERLITSGAPAVGREEECDTLR
jgi:hypothetical protein